MKTQRLTEIVFALLSGKEMTASELAARFSVTARTIYRDIETLSAAGVPVVTQAGKRGGIRLMEGYYLNGASFSESERQAAGDYFAYYAPASKSAFYQKVSSVIPVSKDCLDNDSEAKPDLARENFCALCSAVREKRVIRFCYRNANGQERVREAEPVKLGEKFGNWYLYAFCLVKNEYRFFKLSNMRELTLLDKTFSLRESLKSGVFDALSWNACGVEEVVLIVDESKKEQAFRLFGSGQISASCESGAVEIRFFAHVNDWLAERILSLGDAAEVIAPLFLKEKIRDIHKRAYEKNII